MLKITMYSYDIKIDIFVLTSNYSFLVLWLRLKETFLSSLNKIQWTHTQNALPFYSKSLKEFYLKPFAFGKLRRKYVIGYLLS